METLQKLKVAVTGGSGHIGHRVVEQLVERGHHVINIDRRQPQNPLVKWVFVDTRRRDQVQAVLDQVEAVIHLGEIPGVNNSFTEDELYVNNTQTGSAMFQTAAELKLKRMVYVSTCQVYGCWGHNNIAPASCPMDENHPLRPRNTYALSKVANELYGRYVSERFGLSVGTLRFPGVQNWYKQRPEEALTWLSQQTGKIFEAWDTYLDPDDAARACVLLLENPRPGYEAYHCTAEEVYGGIPLAQRLEKFHPDYPPLPKDWPAFKCPVLTDKIREHVGWKPTFNIVEEYRKKFGKEPGA